MMRRGCRAQLIHFHGYPFVSPASLEKARELASVLTRYQHRTRLYHGQLRRDPAPGRRLRAGAASDDHLSPSHAPYRRAAGATGKARACW